MRVCITTEQRFERTSDGSIWTTGAMPYSFWRRYLKVFDDVVVIARIRDASETGPSWSRADGSRVHFRGVPYYVGVLQFLSKASAIREAVCRSVGDDDALIMRVSSTLAGCLGPVLRTGRPFGLEVVGDPYEALGSIRHPLGFILRHWFKQQLRTQCQHACAVAYVSQSALQRRYPAARRALTTEYSSIELPDDSFAKAPRSRSGVAGPFRIVSVGSMAQPYKRFDLVIDATAVCRRDGLDVELVLVGDGRCSEELRQHAAAAQMSDVVRFRGSLPPGLAIRNELDSADLFVLASSTEGLPRAMIEAMARGVPCLGSAVGGIPELLPEEDLFAPGNAAHLARKMAEVIADPVRLSRMSERNLARSRAYCDSALDERRQKFMERVSGETQRWSEAIRVAA